MTGIIVSQEQVAELEFLRKDPDLTLCDKLGSHEMCKDLDDAPLLRFERSNCVGLAMCPECPKKIWSGKFC